MDYNDLFEDKNTCRDTIQLLFNTSVDSKRFIVNRIVDIKYPKADFFDCLRYGSPYNYTIVYEVGLENDPSTIITSTLVIPKMHNGSYLLLSHGKIRLRTPINLLRISKPISFYGSGKSKFLSIYGALVIHKPFSDNPIVKFNGDDNDYYLKNILDHFEIKYDEHLVGGVQPAISEYPRLLVDERVRDKIKYVMEDVDLPLSDEPNKYELSYENLYKIWKYSLTNPIKLDSTTPFDLIYSDSTTSILTHFKQCKELKDKLRSLYYRSASRGIYKISITPVQRYVDSYFNMQSKVANDLQSSADTNALEQLDQGSKVYLVNSKNEKERLNYTSDFVGIIDPIATPEGANSSLRNSMARCVHVVDGKLYIKVKDPKTLQDVELKLIDYYYSKILTSTSYDYIDNKIIPNKHGNIQIQYKGQYYYIDKDDKFDYIRSSKDSMLSYSAATIPFCNRTDGTRLAMSAASMNMQAIPVIGSIPPIVSTGVGKEIYDKSTLNIKAKSDGEVIGILDQYVKVLNDDNTISIYTMPPPITTSHKTTNMFHIDVNVGDKIVKDQVIISTNSFQKGELALTVPMVIAYMNYGGYEYEDGIVISESAAKRLGHKSIMTLEIPIVKSEGYIFDKDILSTKSEYTLQELSEFGSLNDHMLPDIGQRIEPREMVFTYMYELDPEENKAAKLRKILNEGDIVYQKMIYRAPANVLNGEIIDIRVVTNGIGSPINQLKKYYDDIHDKKKQEVEEFTGITLPEKVSPILATSFEGMIYIDIEYTNAMKKGDKICNLYGSKGLVGLIVPDDEMPRREDGTVIDVIMAQESVINRKNPSQIFEATLGEVGLRAWTKAGELIAKGDYDELRKMLNIIYVTDRYTKYSEEDLLKKYNEYHGYFQIIASAYEERYDKNAMFKILDYFKMPRNGLSKLIFPPSKRFPEGRVSKQGVITGVTSIRRLHFLAEYKSKSTATRTESDETSTGLGLTKSSGQKIGGLEWYAIAAQGAYELISELSPREKRHDIDLNNDLLPLGMKLIVE